jgi:hypothetical protein
LRGLGGVGEEREGLALSKDEGWADDNCGLRCAQYAEGIYCGVGGEKKGGVDDDEILAACQKEFDADFSDDDDDLECDEGTRVQTNIRTETGMRLAVLESAATNVWFDENTFAECKCLFGKRSVELLGHRVSHGLVRPSDDHTAVFENFKEPRNASELLRFNGLVIFYDEHVESAADRLAPLYEVLVGTGWNRKKSKKQRVVAAD